MGIYIYTYPPQMGSGSRDCYLARKESTLVRRSGNTLQIDKFCLAMVAQGFPSSPDILITTSGSDW